jgi:hypothetical protein
VPPSFGFYCNLLGFLVKSSIINWLGALNYFFKYVPPNFFSQNNCHEQKKVEKR